MCHVYNLPCCVCEKVTFQLFYCTDLTERRFEYDKAAAANASTGTAPTSTTAPSAAATNGSTPVQPRPAEHDCHLYNPTTTPVTPVLSNQAPNWTAGRHLCQHCGLLFWYQLHEKDLEGHEALTPEERSRRARMRAEGVKIRPRWVTPI